MPPDGLRPHTCSDSQPRPAATEEAELSRWLDQLDAVDLRALLASMPAIEQAKGILMGYFSITADDAFRILRRWSSTHNLKLRTICAQLSAAASEHHPDRYGALHDYLLRGGFIT